MRIDWDVPIEMDDGLVLRADVFRPGRQGSPSGFELQERVARLRAVPA